MSFFIAFVINYFLIRVSGKKLILAYIENEEDNFRAKVIGFLVLFSLVCVMLIKFRFYYFILSILLKKI